MLEAFDPKAPEELNDYYWMDGRLGTPRPRTAAAQDTARAFDLRDVKFGLLPELVEQARRQFPKLRGITPYAVVSRSRTAPHDLEIDVYCNALRGSGTVTFDRNGAMRSRR